MEFRLTYRGPLTPGQGDSPDGQQQHAIRRAFHRQLQRLWEVTPFLKAGRPGAGAPVFTSHREQAPAPLHMESLAARHSLHGFSFVPLVNQDFDLECALDVLLLRPDPRGGPAWASDGLRTLFDAFAIPGAGEGYDRRTPAADENPLFCLLEHDKLVTKMSVDTDRLLDWDGRDPDETAAVITVRLRPRDATLANLKFG